ncbi:glycosyltransferase [Seongchinamella sediminis]|uniref:Glycosyltransferase n=1 Tax=Seongchinamella sediminis TaxID=2283635 RepID=A0A3L7E1K1_9GAMM|nr:glycosyltransferase [Seongchinamella sediminis]RLQ22213.1 glycosyltransferase [Seongchinamella sediminis]
MNILLLCKRHYTSHDLVLERFGRLYHFPRQWANHGHRVSVLAMDYGVGQPAVVAEDNLTLESYPLFTLRNNFVTALRRQLDTFRPDTIVASGDSHIGYLGARVARRLGIPFVFDLYHNYEDFGSNRILGMKWMYNRALESAALVVCDSEKLAGLVASRCARTLVAEQAVDSGIFYPRDKAECQRELGLPDGSRYLVYIGSINDRFDRDAVLAAMDSLSGQGVETTLLVAGPGLDSVTSAHPRVKYLGRLPHEKMPVVIGAGDVCLIPYAATALAETCHPCKLSEYIACERPIVASRVSNILDYLSLSSGLTYVPGDGDGLAYSLEQQLRDPIIEHNESALKWENIAARYLAHLLNLFSTLGRERSA